MKSSNPVLGKAFNQPTNMQVEVLEQSYNAPAASSMRTGRMTMEDVVAKTGFLFAVLLVVGAIAWTANLGTGALLLGFLGGFVLAMIISFSKNIKPGLVVTYAAFQGLALGTIRAITKVSILELLAKR